MRRTRPKSAFSRLLAVLAMGPFAPPAAVSGAKYAVSHSSSIFARDCVGRESEKLFVLSFDDGPWEYTEEILDVLASKGAPATFFLIGSIFDNFPGLTDKYEGLVRRMLREGHVVANHGMDNDEFTLDDVGQCHLKIKGIADGHNMQYFRPAQGAYTIEKVEELARRDYRTVMWNLDVQDWRADRSPDDMLELLRTAVQNPTAQPANDDLANYGLPRRGSFVMLAHDNHNKMLMGTSGGQPFLGAAIDAIRDAGYRIVSLNECLGVNVPGTGNYCGEDWGDAQMCGAGECPSGMDMECPSGTQCYGGILCTNASDTGEDDPGSSTNGNSGSGSGSGSNNKDDGWDWSHLQNSGSPKRWGMHFPTLALLAVGALAHLF